MSNDPQNTAGQPTLKQELEKLTLRQVIDKKDELKKQAAKLIPQLSTSLDKKSERKKGGKIMDRIKEIFDTMIILDEIQDQKDE